MSRRTPAAYRTAIRQLPLLVAPFLLACAGACSDTSNQNAAGSLAKPLETRLLAGADNRGGTGDAQWRALVQTLRRDPSPASDHFSEHWPAVSASQALTAAGTLEAFTVLLDSWRAADDAVRDRMHGGQPFVRLFLARNPLDWQDFQREPGLATAATQFLASVELRDGTALDLATRFDQFHEAARAACAEVLKPDEPDLVLRYCCENLLAVRHNLPDASSGLLKQIGGLIGAARYTVGEPPGVVVVNRASEYPEWIVARLVDGDPVEQYRLTALTRMFALLPDARLVVYERFNDILLYNADGQEQATQVPLAGVRDLDAALVDDDVRLLAAGTMTTPDGSATEKIAHFEQGVWQVFDVDEEVHSARLGRLDPSVAALRLDDGSSVLFDLEEGRVAARLGNLNRRSIGLLGPDKWLEIGTDHRRAGFVELKMSQEQAARWNVPLTGAVLAWDIVATPDSWHLVVLTTEKLAFIQTGGRSEMDAFESAEMDPPSGWRPTSTTTVGLSATMTPQGQLHVVLHDENEIFSITR